MRIPGFCALALLFLASAAPLPAPGIVRVKLATSAGEIVVALDAKHAPKTVANFLAYVDDGRLNGTLFYRASRRKADPNFGFVQGGIGTNARRMLPSSVPIEPTNVTGLKHLDGTISMAHGPNPDSGTANFSIMVGPNPALDAHGSFKGFAAFGQVVSGMAVVKKMLAMPTGGGRDEMKDQMILAPVRIVTATRLDGTPKPTSYPRTWLMFQN
jgi:peptidyl-prolyl cis-trans isomerase A (cyclophilin A)